MENYPISVCVGSSCFELGNSNKEAFINKIIAIKRRWNDIELKGELCHDACVQRLITTIGSKIYSALATLSLKEIFIKKQY
jgi:NADH:ubiquinone oxidoreductase subunit E